MNTLALVFALYLLFGGGSSLYHAGKGDYAITFKRSELLISGIFYLGLMAILVIST